MEEPRTCFIGGEKFDPDRVEEYVLGLDPKQLVVTGEGRGAEERVKTMAALRGMQIRVPPLQLQLFSGIARVRVEKALKLQVVDVYVQALLGGKLVLVGAGSRVEDARAMLTRSSAWPMEVEEL